MSHKGIEMRNSLRARLQHRRALGLHASGELESATKTALAALLLLPVDGTSFRKNEERVRILLTLAKFAADTADHAKTERWLQEAATLLQRQRSDQKRDDLLCDVLVQHADLKRQEARFQEAREKLSEAAELNQARHLNTSVRAGWHNALGILERDTGHYQSAREHYTDALGLLSLHYGADSPYLASLHHNLAGLAYSQKRFDDAEWPARRALALRLAERPRNPLTVAADTSVLGAVLAGQGKYDESERLLLRSLEVWRSRYGNAHYEVAVQLHNLGAIHEAREDYNRSEQYYLEALGIKQKVLGPSHPEVAAILNSLSIVQARQGHTDAGLKSHTLALELFRKALGHDHPKTLRCGENGRLLHCSSGCSQHACPEQSYAEL
jgi:tetratricopeptide (TPR) repeat protein